jgi:hypothetical protein
MHHKTLSPSLAWQCSGARTVSRYGDWFARTFQTHDRFSPFQPVFTPPASISVHSSRFKPARPSRCADHERQRGLEFVLRVGSLRTLRFRPRSLRRVQNALSCCRIPCHVTAASAPSPSGRAQADGSTRRAVSPRWRPPRSSPRLASNSRPQCHYPRTRGHDSVAAETLSLATPHHLQTLSFRNSPPSPDP